MTQIIFIIKTLLQLFPLIIAAIKTVEDAFPHAQQGAAKLDMVKDVVKTAYDAGTATVTGFETLAPGIEAIAKGAVTIYNSAGVFKKIVPVVEKTRTIPPTTFDGSTS